MNWRKVAGENDNVHDHWVEGFGDDIITDYSKDEGDKIIVRGHTVEIASVTYGEDDGGTYSLISVRSQQGNGGAGGANTATGAHDEDSLGTIKVYGDKVNEGDIKVQAAGVFDGMDMLADADRYVDVNGGVTEARSDTDGDEIVTAPADLETNDRVYIEGGAQSVSTGAGRDSIWVYADAGEPDPAQTNGSAGRINPAVDPSTASDIISGGQGKDHFTFNMLLNATSVVLARHTKDDGSINWRRVAGENEEVHDHWVEGIGNDVLLDFSNQDGDKLTLRGHTVDIADITYGGDEGGDFSLISIRSQQGDGGGAHDEDSLGTLKVYGDKVTADDIEVKKTVFDGVDAFDGIDGRPTYLGGTNESEELIGTAGADNIHADRGNDIVHAGDGDDFVFGEGGSDVLFGEGGDDWLEGSWGRDAMHGGAGEDTLVSTSGVDEMTGGSDADTFMFKDASRGGLILDWEEGADIIDLSRLENVDRFGDLDIAQVDATSAVVTFANDNGQEAEINVVSVAPFSLTEADFIM